MPASSPSSFSTKQSASCVALCPQRGVVERLFHSGEKDARTDSWRAPRATTATRSAPGARTASRSMALALRSLYDVRHRSWLTEENQNAIRYMISTNQPAGGGIDQLAIARLLLGVVGDSLASVCCRHDAQCVEGDAHGAAGSTHCRYDNGPLCRRRLGSRRFNAGASAHGSRRHGSHRDGCSCEHSRR